MIILAAQAPGSPPGLQPDQVLGFVLLDIAIILIVARSVGLLAKRLGQPTVVGEIVGGILLGPTLLGRTVFAWDRPWSFLHCDAALRATSGAPSISACFFPPQSRSMLSVLGQIALVLFMFLVGLELDWDLLRGKGRSIAIVSLGAVAIPIGLGFAIGPGLYQEAFVAGFGTPEAPSKLSFTLFIAAMLSVTAFPVMARILQEKGLISAPLGSIGIAAAAVVTVLMFLTVAVAAGIGGKSGPSNVGVKFVLAAAFIAALFGVIRPALMPLGRRYETSGGLTSGVFAAVLAMVFVSAYVAHQIGINVIVGGFLAGVILPARQALFRDMAARLSDLTAVILLPIFLAFSGLNTDFTKVALGHLPGIALFLGAGVAGKWLGGAVAARVGGLSWAQGNVLGILLNCRGLLVLVVALIGFTQNVISAPMQVGGVLMALVTTIMTGPLVDAFLPRATAPEPQPIAGTPSVFRVLTGLDDLDVAPEVTHAALAVAGNRQSVEVILCRLFPLPEHGEVLSGINDHALEAERSLRALRLLGSFAPANVSVIPLAFSSVDPPNDLLRVAREQACDVLVTGWRTSHEVVMKAPCAVVVVRSRGQEPDNPHGPVSLVVTSADDGFADRLARQLAASAGCALDRVAPGDRLAMVDAAKQSSALVVVSDHIMDDEVVAAASCAVYLVRPAPITG